MIFIYTHNISGGTAKLPKLNHKLATTHFDVVLIQETWFSDKIDSQELIHSTDFLAFRKDRDFEMNKLTRGGGVLTLINKELTVINIETVAITIADTKITLVRKMQNDLIIINTYWPPQGKKIEMTNELIQNIRKIKTKFSGVPILLVGDFNVGINWSYSEDFDGFLVPSNQTLSNNDQYFFQNLHEIGLHQINDLPNSRGKYLDLVFTSVINSTQTYEPVHSDCFDQHSVNHNAIAIETNFKLKSAHAIQEKNYKKTNLRVFKSKLNSTTLPPFDENKTEEELENSICEIAEKLSNKIFELQNASTTTTKKTYAKATVNKSHPFLRNKTYEKLRKERDRIKNINRGMPTPDNKKWLNEANVKLYQKFNELKENYFANLINEMGDDRKNFYAYLKVKKKENTCMPQHMVQGNQHFEGDERFTALNKHFISAYTIDSHPLPSNNIELKREVENIYNREYSQNFQYLWEHANVNFMEEEITDKINHLKINSDCGPMLIENEVLKRGGEKIAPALARIFNLLIKDGSFPEEWKKSFLIPIPKPGKSNEISNYRGVCIQSSLPKIFDALFTKKLTEIMKPLIPASQHGFTPNKGTTTNLLEMANFVGTNIIGKGQVDCIYLDLSKAFDKISHRKLIIKLCRMSAPLKIIQCIAAFICNRQYYLKVENKITGKTHFSTSAVPQGSHLGPLLYILFCMDLPNCLDGTEVSLLSYADDTKIYRSIKSQNDAEELQKVMDRIIRWLEENGLEINQRKTFTLSFTRSSTMNFNAIYFIENHQIETKTEMRDLGIIFDRKLNFGVHTNYIEKRAKCMHGAAYRFANEIHNQKIVLPIIQSYITPILEYGAIIWRRNTQVQNRKIEMSQRFGTRLYLGRPFSIRDPRYLNYEERLKRCNLMTMEQRFKIAAIIFICKCIQGIIKSEIANEIIERRTPPIRTRNPLYFKTDNLPMGGPLSQALNIANENRNHFSLEESTQITKRSMKQYFLSMNG